MKTLALIACFALVVACGGKEETTPSTDGPGGMPGKADVEKMKEGGPTPGGATMRTVKLDITGMT